MNILTPQNHKGIVCSWAQASDKRLGHVRCGGADRYSASAKVQGPNAYVQAARLKAFGRDHIRVISPGRRRHLISAIGAPPNRKMWSTAIMATESQNPSKRIPPRSRWDMTNVVILGERQAVPEPATDPVAVAFTPMTLQNARVLNQQVINHLGDAIKIILSLSRFVPQEVLK